MTKQEALQLVDIELDLLEDGTGVPLFHVKDTGDEIVCLFNDPRVSTIVVEYDSERMGNLDNSLND